MEHFSHKAGELNVVHTTSLTSKSFTQAIHTSYPHKPFTQAIHTSHSHKLSTQAIHTSHPHKLFTLAIHTSYPHKPFKQAIHTSHPHKPSTQAIHTSHPHKPFTHPIGGCLSVLSTIEHLSFVSTWCIAMATTTLIRSPFSDVSLFLPTALKVGHWESNNSISYFYDERPRQQHR